MAQHATIVGDGISLDLPNRPSERPGPRGGARDANRRAQALRIAHAALELFVERGTESVTIDEIAARAGIAKGSFYRYFDDRTALVEAVVAPFRRALVEAGETCRLRLASTSDPMEAAAAYAALATAVAPVVVENGLLVRLYLQESRLPPRGAVVPLHLLARTIDDIAVALSETAARTGLVTTVPAVVAARVVTGALEQLAATWLAGRLTLPVEAITDATMLIILRGVWATED
jgi:AcrR family transcriptional regulator